MTWRWWALRAGLCAPFVFLAVCFVLGIDGDA